MSIINKATNKDNQATHNRNMTLEEEIWQDRPAPNRNFSKQGIDRHLIANENNDKQKRTWGYKGQRVGEASNPGPWDSEQEYNKRRMDKSLSDMANNISQTITSSHENWKGDNMDIKRDASGCRISTQNFERKFYNSEETITEAIEKMETMGINIMIITEPGQASYFNQIRAKRVARSFGYDLKLIIRNRDTISGGIIILMDRAWSRIPSNVEEFVPKEMELRGRLMEITFNNKQDGQHNKIQIIGAHLMNSANTKKEETSKLLSWIATKKCNFTRQNPLATSVLIGDLNAAETEHLDTDREGTDPTEEKSEADRDVIQTIKDMKYGDIIRERFPKTRIVTRSVSHQTNRLLDRILATKEVAKHPETRIGVYKHSLTKAGSDHLMILADLPVDTAGSAAKRVEIWTPYSYTRWKKPECTEEEMKEKLFAMNEEVRNSTPENPDTLNRIKQAMRNHVLEEETIIYPKRPNHKKHYSSSDWRIQQNLQNLRHLIINIRMETLSGNNYEDHSNCVDKTRNKIKYDKADPVKKAEYQRMWNRLKTKKAYQCLVNLESWVELQEEYLGKIQRYERVKKIKINLRRRKDRFNSTDKTLLKPVINSIMQRYQAQQHITSAESTREQGDSVEYSEKAVAKAIVKFFEEWMGGVAKVEDRWGTWEKMMNMDTSEMKNEEHKELIETAYRESYDKFNELQKVEGIWDTVKETIWMKDVREGIKSFKVGKTPGPSTVSVEMLEWLDDENLEEIANIMDQILQGRHVPSSWNQTLLKPIPKTEEGVYDITKTRPIALMEIILKVYERIIFDRITKIIYDHNMLRTEQYGGLQGRIIQDPIRILAELIDDANVTGRELHIFSADLTKAFDTLEYWSQAMSWRAIGTPHDIVEMIIDMDKGGQTAVALAPGKSTQDILGKEGLYSNKRGVRQGSVGGPLKWVLFMNFWLEYVHKKRQGEGYKMNEETPEIIGQMMIDDSNWFTTTAEGMTDMIKDCTSFVQFHGLKFNEKKCEYMAINQKEERDEEGMFSGWINPKWPDGKEVETTARKAVNEHKWKKEHKEMEHQITLYEGTYLETGETEQLSQCPDQEDLIKIRVLMHKYRKAIANNTISDNDKNTMKDKLTKSIDKVKGIIYLGRDMDIIKGETTEWLFSWNEWVTLLEAHKTHTERATRYLGVYFNMDKSWRAQQKVLTEKFEGLYERISQTKPTTEMAVYCINAVINAALKFPLQVAKMPVALLREWDRKHLSIVKEAGKLPRNTSPELIQLPKDRGGKGLQSIEKEVDTMRIQSQMRLLNSDSKAGAVVRAAEKRRRKGKESKTIQAYTRQAADRWGLRIATIESVGGTTVAEQAIIDIDRTTTAKRVGNTVHCFGDGATWPGISGWGIYARDEQGNILSNTADRTPGKQQNDASEAFAILQGLINTNPMDPIKLYCDNQGCVQVWNTQSKYRRNFEAIWARIDSLRRHRELMGAETEMIWVQSHIQDEKKRTSNRSMLTCACRLQTGNIEECTIEGDKYHWIHEGNDSADEAAKSTQDMEITQSAGEIARGESGYILYLPSRTDNENIVEVAQGDYREWIKEKIIEKTIKDCKTVGLQHIKRAKEHSHENMWATMIANLGGKITWRFWSRLMTRSLPTNHKLSKMVNSEKDNIYKWVYRDELGTDGRCNRKDCQCETETTQHAIIDCDESQLLWMSLDAHISAQWALQAGGEEWDRISWISNTYQGWEPLWTAAGAIPAEVEHRIGRVDPTMHSRLIEAANQCASLATKIWGIRNDSNEEWIDSIPSLRERKSEAGRKQWNYTKEGEVEQQKKERTKTRINKRKAERELHKKDAIIEAKELHRKDIESRNKKAKLNKRLGVSEELAAIEEENIIKQTKKEVNKLHSHILRLAKYAGKTPDIVTENTTNVDTMHDTLPNTTSKKINLKRGPDTFHRIPKVRSNVRIFWADKNGTTKHNNLRGQWVPGKVTALEWPEGRAMPGVRVTYLDETTEFCPMNMCGDTIELIKEPKGKDGIKHTEIFPAEVTEWLGKGSRLQVKFKKIWCVGEVVGRNNKGILVKYNDGICTHDDLHKRGCRIRQFMRHTDEEEEYEKYPNMKCPYLEEDEECTCVVCRKKKWPARYSIWNLTPGQISEIESIRPERRLYPTWNSQILSQLAPSQLENSEPENSENSVAKDRHLIADNEQHGNDDESGRADAQRDDEDEEGSDVDKELPCDQTDTLEQEQQADRQEEGSSHMGLRRTADRVRRAQEQGHVDHGGAKRNARGEHTRGTWRNTKRASPSNRDERDSEGVGRGKRRGGSTRSIRGAAGETEPIESSQKEDGTDQRRPDGNNGNHRRASKRRNGDTAANTEQDSQTRQVGELDRRRSAVDGTEQMDRRLRSRRNDTEGKGDEREIHNSDKTNDASAEPGGGVEISRQSNSQPDTRGPHCGSRQKRPHVHGHPARHNHSRTQARLDEPEDRPDKCALEESIDQPKSLGPDNNGDGMYPVQQSKHHQPGNRLGARAVGSDTTEQSKRTTRQSRGGAGTVQAGSGGSRDADTLTGAAPRDPIPGGEPSAVGPMGPGGNHTSNQQESRLEGSEGRQVCVRETRAKGNQIPHERRLAAGGQDREREVRQGVHGNSDRCRQNQTPVPDNGEQLRQTRPAGRQSQRHQVRADAGRSGERHRRRTPGGIPQNILDDEIVGPRTGPTQTQGDYHETDPKTNQTTTQKTQRRHLNKRTRENGTSGGTRGEDSNHGHIANS